MRILTKITLAALIFFSANTIINAQNSAIGGRIHLDLEYQDAFGVTYKKYFDGKAFEINGMITSGFDWIGGIANYYFIHNTMDLGFDGLQGYVGAGGQIWIGDSFVLGPDAVIGAEYEFEGAPVNVFLDLTILARLVTEYEQDLFGGQLGLGLRKIF